MTGNSREELRSKSDAGRTSTSVFWVGMNVQHKPKSAEKYFQVKTHGGFICNLLQEMGLSQFNGTDQYFHHCFVQIYPGLVAPKLHLNWSAETARYSFTYIHLEVISRSKKEEKKKKKLWAATDLWIQHQDPHLFLVMKCPEWYQHFLENDEHLWSTEIGNRQL